MLGFLKAMYADYSAAIVLVLAAPVEIIRKSPVCRLWCYYVCYWVKFTLQEELAWRFDYYFEIAKMNTQSFRQWPVSTYVIHGSHGSLLTGVITGLKKITGNICYW